MTQSMGFDVAHLLAGTLLVLSFVLLYQARITAVLPYFPYARSDKKDKRR